MLLFKNVFRSPLLLFILFMVRIELSAQCSGGAFGGVFSPTASSQTMAVTDGNYYEFSVTGSGSCNLPTYVFSFCSAEGGNASYDTQLTILDNSGSPVPGGYNDDYCSLQSQVTWTPAASGTYRLLVNRYSCTTGGGSATLAYRLSGGGGAVNPSFSLVDDATNGSGYECIQLTAAVNNQRGCAWDNAHPLDFSLPFSIDYTINLGSNNGGADGMAFVIQNDPAGTCACGTAGGGLAAMGITNSLIIEIDTYLNTEDRDDGLPGVLCSGGAEPDHLDLWLNGNINPLGVCGSSPGARIIPAAIPLLDGALDYNIENGLDHIFRITWSGGVTGTLTATVLNAAATQVYGTLNYTLDPMVIFGTTTPNYGFTASTGGLNNQQSFCSPLTVMDGGYIQFQAFNHGNFALLNWQAEEDSDLEYYILEKSLDQNSYIELVRVHAGGINATKDYQFSDQHLQDGENYYRLKLINRGGAIRFSETILLKNDLIEPLTCFPNPAKDHVTINGLTENSDIEISDLGGKLLMKIHQDSGDPLRTDISSLVSGLYLLKIKTSENIKTIKLVVE